MDLKLYLASPFKSIMKALKILFVALLITSCSGDSVGSNCNFLPNVTVDAVINLNLPQFNDLNFTSGVVRLSGQGNAGVYLIRANNQTILAWDGADPAQPLASCSTMTLDGTEVSSSCAGDNVYSLFTGAPVSGPTNCTLKPYRITPIGDNVFQLSN